MPTLQEFLDSIQYRITEGSTYEWTCYGVSAHSLDYWNGSSGAGRSANIVFDTRHQTVYEMQAFDEQAMRAWRWIHPDYLASVKAEYVERGLDFEQAIDDEKFIDIDNADMMLQQIRLVVSGLPTTP